MARHAHDIKIRAVKLRKSGHSYTEIQNVLGKEIPKATLYYWFRNIEITVSGAKRLEGIHSSSLRRAQKASILVRAGRRKAYFDEKVLRNSYLQDELSSDSVRKVVIAILYLAEGSKSERGQLTFGNSDPDIIRLFLGLLRESFIIDERKFRCTLQARDDQDISGLENFWSEVTGVPLSQFYKARIDPRSVGKISRKKEYKGVCRVNYFSSDLLYELMVIGTLLKGARSSAG